MEGISGYFHNFIENHRNRGLIVQPRMGFSRIEQMREGLKRVKAIPCDTIGTITLDSKTRLNLFDDVKIGQDFLAVFVFYITSLCANIRYGIVVSTI